jgi:hypothetical protein
MNHQPEPKSFTRRRRVRPLAGHPAPASPFDDRYRLSAGEFAPLLRAVIELTSALDRATDALDDVKRARGLLSAAMVGLQLLKPK